MIFYCDSSTSNETLTRGSNLTSALSVFFPSLNSTDLQEFVEVYPETDFTSKEQWTLVSTGEPTVVCGRNNLGAANSKVAQTWTYRYNQPNPTSGPPNVTMHAAENWMMFNGTNTSYVLNILRNHYDQQLFHQVQWYLRIHTADTGRIGICRRAHCILGVFCANIQPQHL